MGETQFPDDSMPLGVDDVETAVFEGEAVLFRESTRSVHRMNALAGAVWVMCDGETTVAGMVDELAELFDTDATALHPGVLEALEQLAEVKLLQGMSDEPTVVLTPVDEEASDGSRIIACPPDY